MPSLGGRILEWLLWALYYRNYHKSFNTRLTDLAREWPTHQTPEKLPKIITDNKDVVVKREEFTAESTGQEWEVFHFDASEEVKATRDVKEKEKVVVYWHGGSFTYRTHIVHYHTILRLLRLSYPTILPIYTLAPLSTATSCISSATDLLFQLSTDPRYKDKEIVLAGDSAGGWIVLRLLEAMCEMALGENGDGERAEKAKKVMARMGRGIMISACVDLELNPAVKAWAPHDFWLHLDLFDIHLPLWAYGPLYFPTGTFTLPPSHTPPTLAPVGERKPISDKTYSPIHGVDVFKRYRETFGSSPIRLLQLISKNDLCYPGNVQLKGRLEELGEEVVKSEIIVEEGLYHVYAIIGLLKIPEFRKAWRKIGEFLSADLRSFG